MEEQKKFNVILRSFLSMFLPHPDLRISSAAPWCPAGMESHVGSIDRKQGDKAGQCPRWGQKGWQSPPLDPQPPGPLPGSSKMRYGKERRKEVKKEGKTSRRETTGHYMPPGGRIQPHLRSSLAKKLSLGLIKTLVLTTNVQERHKTEQHGKCHHRVECKIQTVRNSIEQTTRLQQIKRNL